MRSAPAVTWLDRGVCPPEVRLPVAEARVRRDERPPVITIGIDPASAARPAARSRPTPWPARPGRAAGDPLRRLHRRHPREPTVAGRGTAAVTRPGPASANPH